MRCSPVSLGALADSELRGLAAWRVRRHVAHCPACQQELAALEGLSQTLRTASPLPARKPIRRPIGIVRPVAVTLAMAGVAAALCLRLPAPSETESEARPVSLPPLRVRKPQQQALLPTPKAPKAARVAAPSASSQPRQPRLQVARRKRHHKPLTVAKAKLPPKPETEQIIVIATVMPPPKPVTVILDNNDDDGGTIHIESTIPAAYVVAMQKEQN